MKNYKLLPWEFLFDTGFLKLDDNTIYRQMKIEYECRMENIKIGNDRFSGSEYIIVCHNVN